MFLRLVELDKLRLGTRKEEAKELAAKGGVDPYIVLMPASASRGGVSEKLVRVCEECREEFCSGNCIIFQYDSYQVPSQLFSFTQLTQVLKLKNI